MMHASVCAGGPACCAGVDLNTVAVTPSWQQQNMAGSPRARGLCAAGSRAEQSVGVRQRGCDSPRAWGMIGAFRVRRLCNELAVAEGQGWQHQVVLTCIREG